MEKAQRRPGRTNPDSLCQSHVTSSMEGQASSPQRTSSTSPRWSIAVSASDQAASFFFTGHVNEASESCSLIYNYLPRFYDADHSSALSHVIKAIGLAGLSSYRSARTLMSPAYSHYSLALSSIRSTLGDPALATTDQTLLTIYLLGIYEVRLNCLRNPDTNFTRQTLAGRNIQ